MKKIISVLLACVMILFLCACGKKENVKEVPNKDFEEMFRDAQHVLCGVLEKNDTVWEARCLSDVSTIKRISKNGFVDGGTQIMVSINDVWIDEYGYRAYITPYEEYINIVVVSENDNASQTWKYSWDGEYLEGFSEELDRYLPERIIDIDEDESDSVVSLPAASDTSASYYVGRPAQEVFDNYGRNYYTTPMNKGMGFVYDEGIWFKYLNYVDFASNPASDSVILEIMIDGKGIEVYKGVEIGDSLGDVEEKIGVSWYDGSMQAKSYITGAVITWNLDFADKSIILATVTKE